MNETSIPAGWTLVSWQGGAVAGPVESVVPIQTAEELQSELERLRMERPQYVEVLKPGVGVMCLGIAPSVAAVEWREGDDLRCIIRAVARAGDEPVEVEFAAPGGSLEYEAEYMLPYPAALKIILHCVQHGSFPTWAPRERQLVGKLDVERRETG
jgi:hypothetical protein